MHRHTGGAPAGPGADPGAEAPLTQLLTAIPQALHGLAGTAAPAPGTPALTPTHTVSVREGSRSASPDRRIQWHR